MTSTSKQHHNLFGLCKIPNFRRRCKIIPPSCHSSPHVRSIRLHQRPTQEHPGPLAQALQSRQNPKPVTCARQSFWNPFICDECLECVLTDAPPCNSQQGLLQVHSHALDSALTISLVELGFMGNECAIHFGHCAICLRIAERIIPTRRLVIRTVGRGLVFPRALLQMSRLG